MVFVINLLITYPLMINPANEVIENFLFAKRGLLASQRYWAGLFLYLQNLQNLQYYLQNYIQ